MSAELRKQASDAIVTPKNKGGEWTADAPSQAPYNFSFHSLMQACQAGRALRWLLWPYFFQKTDP